jgi:hypothetical protein
MPLPKKVPKWLYNFLEYVVNKEKTGVSKKICAEIVPQYLDQYWELFKEKELKQLEKKRKNNEAEQEEKKKRVNPQKVKKGLETALSKYQQAAVEGEPDQADDIRSHFKEQIEQLPQVLKSAVASASGNGNENGNANDDGDVSEKGDTNEGKQREDSLKKESHKSKANELYQNFVSEAKQKKIEPNDPLHTSVDQLHEVVVQLTT